MPLPLETIVIELALSLDMLAAISVSTRCVMSWVAGAGLRVRQ